MRIFQNTLFTTLLLFAFCGELWAEYVRVPESTFDPSIMKVKEKEFLDTKVYQDVPFIDENGKEFTLKERIGKPIILMISYYSCDGFCETVNKNLRDSLEWVKFKAGVDYDVLTLSFDRHDDLKKLHEFKEKLDLPKKLQDGWTVALFKNPDDIVKLTSQVGYRFFWSKRDGIFLHPSVYIFLSPEGRVMRYMYSSKVDTKDMDLAITETWGNKISFSKTLDFVTLACYSYNYKDGKYSINFPVIIGGVSLLVGLLLTLGALYNAKRRIS